MITLDSTLPRSDLESILRFMQSENTKAFLLEGESNESIEFNTFCGIFSIYGEEKLVFLELDPNGQSKSLLKTYDKVLHMTVPKDVDSLGIIEDGIIADLYISECDRAKKPYIVLGFGRAKDTKKDITTLFSVPGMSPKSGLNKIQTSIFQRVSRFN